MKSSPLSDTIISAGPKASLASRPRGGSASSVPSTRTTVRCTGGMRASPARHAVPVVVSGSHVFGAVHVTDVSSRATARTVCVPKRHSVEPRSPKEARPEPTTTTVVPPSAGPPRGVTSRSAIR